MRIKLATFVLLFAVGTASARYVTSIHRRYAGTPSVTEMTITFSGYTGTETLTNFPVLVVLEDGIGGFYYNLLDDTNGGDIRFEDSSSNEIPYEIDTWNASGTSYLWATVPTLVDNASYVKCTWAGGDSTPPVYTTNGGVWIGAYTSVLHMADTTDSASNSITWTAVNSAVVTNDGQIGKSTYFNRTGGAATVDAPQGTFNSLGSGPLTFDYWQYLVRFTTPSSGVTITHGASHFFLCMKGYMRGTTSGSQSTMAIDTNGVNTSNGWHHVALTYALSTNLLYVDGIFRGSYIGAINVPSAQLMFINAGGSASVTNGIVGMIDEVRFSRINRSSDWIWATYMNVASNSVFQTYTEG